MKSDWTLMLAVVSLAVAAAALIISLLRNRWLARQFQLNSAISIINWLEDPQVRSARETLYTARDEKTAFSEWDVPKKTAAYIITRRFDTLGLLDSLGYVDPRFVDRFYAIPATEIWDICKDWIGEERVARGPKHLWEFEKFADRVRHARDNHPAVRKERDWKKRPRKERT